MRRQSFVGFALVCLAIGLAAYFLGRWSARTPVPAEPAVSKNDAGPEPAGERQMTFDELAAMIAGRGDAPEAAGFGRAFMNRPRLKKIYDRFVEQAAYSRAHQAPPPTARDFVSELRKEADFAALVAQASRNAALRGLAEEMGRKPGMAEALRGAARVPPRTYGLSAAKPAASPRVFGVSAPASAERLSPTEAEADGRPASIGSSSRGRGGTEPRIEGHWVHDGVSPDYMAVCRMLSSAQDCERVVADCRRDASCSRSLSGGAHGAVGVSTAPARPPEPNERPKEKK